MLDPAEHDRLFDTVPCDHYGTGIPGRSAALPRRAGGAGRLRRRTISLPYAPTRRRRCPCVCSRRRARRALRRDLRSRQLRFRKPDPRHLDRNHRQGAAATLRAPSWSATRGPISIRRNPPAFPWWPSTSATPTGMWANSARPHHLAFRRTDGDDVPGADLASRRPDAGLMQSDNVLDLAPPPSLISRRASALGPAAGD